MKTLTFLFFFFFSLTLFSQVPPLSHYEDSLTRNILIVYEGKKASEQIKDMENLGKISGIGEDMSGKYYKKNEKLRLNMRKKAAALKAEIIVILEYHDNGLDNQATGIAYRKKVTTTTEEPLEPKPNTNETE